MYPKKRQGTLVSSVGGAAFALLKADGSVVAWGDASSGGHLSRSQETTERPEIQRETGRIFP